MNFMLRIALQLLAAFIVLLICIQVIIFGVAWLFWPDLIRTGSTSNHYEIFVVVMCSVLFVVTLLLIGWYLGKPIYIMILWIRRLVSGRFDPPPGWKDLRSDDKGTLKIPYSIYKEVFEHLRMLGSTLQNNEKALVAMPNILQKWSSHLTGSRCFHLKLTIEELITKTSLVPGPLSPSYSVLILLSFLHL